MKKSPMPRRKSALRSSGRPTGRNRKRSAKNLERAHGPIERREWIKTLPCYECGATGHSDGAHIKNGGMSKKADAKFTIPLCHSRWSVLGCHDLQHSPGGGWSKLLNLNTIEKREAAATDIEAQWQAHVAELSGRAEAWRYVRLVRIARRISVEAIAKEARLRPETLVRFETGVGSGPALRRVKYAIERLLRAHPDDQRRS